MTQSLFGVMPHCPHTVCLVPLARAAVYANGKEVPTAEGEVEGRCSPQAQSAVVTGLRARWSDAVAVFNLIVARLDWFPEVACRGGEGGVLNSVVPRDVLVTATLSGAGVHASPAMLRPPPSPRAPRVILALARPPGRNLAAECHWGAGWVTATIASRRARVVCSPFARRALSLGRGIQPPTGS